MANFRFFYKSDEGQEGYELFEGRNEEEARRKARRFFNDKYDGFEITRVQPMAKSGKLQEDQKKKKEEEDKDKDKPKAKAGDSDPDDLMEFEKDMEELNRRRAEHEAWLAEQEALEEERRQAREEERQAWEQQQKIWDQERKNRINNDDPRNDFDPSKLDYGGGIEDDAMRRQLIEGQSNLAGFLEGLGGAFGGATPGGYQGRNYLESLFHPSAAAYDVLNTLGTRLAGTEGGDDPPLGDFTQFTRNLFDQSQGGVDPRGALGQLLSSGLSQLANVGDLSSITDPRVQASVGAMINPDMTEDPEAVDALFNLARQAQQQQFSPLALRAIQRGQRSPTEMYADYVRQLHPQGGSPQTPNFARFVQQRFGL